MTSGAELPEMEACVECGSTKRDGPGCTIAWALAYGDEPRNLRRETLEPRCWVCDALLGDQHHYGCSRARCAICGDQAMACWPDGHVALA